MTELPLPTHGTAPPRNRTLRRFLRHRLAVVGLAIIVILTVACIGNLPGATFEPPADRFIKKN